jgi:zinc/manganese transport system substrate-binding protein
MTRLARPTTLLLATALLAAGVAACCGGASGPAAPGPGGKLEVVAVENFWGSLAAQVGGDRVHVTSIIANPSTDPHDYEPTAADGRTLASANVVIVNGIGYDPWADKLLAANPVSGRIEVRVGDVVGLRPGDNPHRWYSPADVERVIRRITSDYERAAPGDAAYFAAQARRLEATGLRRYHALIAAIRSKYAGTPVGASESIFAPLAADLGLKLITPPGFLKATSEGSDPTASDTSTAHDQITGRKVKVWVYNSQNATPDIKRLNEQARANRIPVATVTETLTPPGASFQQWQVGELERLQAALRQGTGR